MSTIDEYGTGGTGKKIENDEFTVITAGTETVFYIAANGADTQTARYMNMGRGVNKWSFTPSAAVQISEINGTVLKVAKTVGANKEWTGEKGLLLVSFKVVVPNANTDLKLTIK